MWGLAGGWQWAGLAPPRGGQQSSRMMNNWHSVKLIFINVASINVWCLLYHYSTAAASTAAAHHRTSPSSSSFQQLPHAETEHDWTQRVDTGHGSATTLVAGLGCLLDKVEQCQGTKSTKFLLPVDKQTINSNVVTHSVTRQKIHTFKGEKINKSKCKNFYNWKVKHLGNGLLSVLCLCWSSTQILGSVLYWAEVCPNKI